MERFTLLASFIILFGVAHNVEALSDQDRLYPAIGHWGGVHVVEYSPGLARVVTAGEDGTIKIWSAERPRLVRVHTISPHALTHLALHPNLPHAAVIENAGASRPVLSVWNWVTGQLVFRSRLRSAPLSMGYSPQGSFLVYTTESRDSVAIISAEDGSVVDHGVARTGIASSFTISASEDTLMAYTPGNGRFTYYSIRDGSVLQAVRSEPNLETLTILPNRRLGVAIQGESLVVVDILRGSILERIEIPNIQSIAVNEVNSDVGVLHSQHGQYYYRTWQIDQNGLREREQLLRELSRPPVILRFFDGKSLVASEDGTISYFFARSRYPRVLSSDRRLPIRGVAYSAGQLYLQSDESFLQFSGLESASTTSLGLSLRNLSESSLQLPAEGSYAVHGALLGNLWFRRTDRTQPHLYQLHAGRTNAVTRSEYEFDSDVVGHHVAKNRILVETETGRLVLWNPRTSEIEYTHSAPEISAYAYDPAHGLSIGTNSAAGSGRTLVHINPDTGETIPLSTPSFITTDIVFSDTAGSLYALGVEHSQSGEFYTRLDRWSGAGYSLHENLYRVAGADWNARLASVPGTNKVWALPSTGSIQVWQNGVQLPVEDAAGAFYVDLGVYGDLVYAVHRSGEVSFYSASKTQKLLTLYLFRDQTWVAITPDQQFLLSAGAVPEDYLIVVPGQQQNEAPGSVSLTRFRLPLPIAE